MEPLTAQELRSLPLARLEALYTHDRPIEVPRGRFLGRVLARLDNRGARRLRWRATQVAMFEWTPFGIDFDRHRWFFLGPKLRVGSFDAEVERSYWRDTKTVTLRYDRSRLPHVIKGVLYDEVKPLSADLALGLGGIDAEAGEGDHFFFSLERMR